jgi:hypothetical protein
MKWVHHRVLVKYCIRYECSMVYDGIDGLYNQSRVQGACTSHVAVPTNSTRQTSMTQNCSLDWQATRPLSEQRLSGLGCTAASNERWGSTFIISQCTHPPTCFNETQLPKIIRKTGNKWDYPGLSNMNWENCLYDSVQRFPICCLPGTGHCTLLLVVLCVLW